MAFSGSPGPFADAGAPIATCIGLLVISLVVQALYLSPLITPYDEGLILYGAAEVARGDVPYRDFWSLYGPASFYGLGMVFHLFGETVLNARIYDAVFRALIVLFTFLVLQAYTTRRSAVTVSLATLILLAGLQQTEFPVYPATACSLCGVWFAAGRAPFGRTAAAWLATESSAGSPSRFEPTWGSMRWSHASMRPCCYAPTRAAGRAAWR